jgi:hypothetical protein
LGAQGALIPKCLGAGAPFAPPVFNHGDIIRRGARFKKGQKKRRALPRCHCFCEILR